MPSERELSPEWVASLTDEEVLHKTCRGKLGPGMVGQALYDRAQAIIEAGGIPEIDHAGQYLKKLPPGATKGHAAAKSSRARKRKH